MKKVIFFISVLLLAGFAYGQIVQSNPMSGFGFVSSPTALYRANGLFYPVAGMINAEFADTTAANSHCCIKNAPGVQIRVKDTIFLRSWQANRWVNMFSSGIVIGQRFGVSGEDVYASANRLFDLYQHRITIRTDRGIFPRESFILDTTIWQIGAIGSANIVGENITTGEIQFTSPIGGYRFDNLTNLSTQNRLIGQVSGSRHIGYVSPGFGILINAGNIRIDTSVIPTQFDVSVLGDSTWVDAKHYFPTGVTLASATTAQKTTAFQAAITDAQNKGYGLKFSGIWQVNANSINITESLMILGIGYNSKLITADNGTVLNVNISPTSAYYNVIFSGYKPVIFQDFTIQYIGAANPASSSIAVKFTSTNSINFQHRVERVTIDSFYTGIQLNNQANVHIYESYFRNNRAWGILTTNDQSQDYGKLIVDKCVFTTIDNLLGQADSSSHIMALGGAGYSITNNDFYGYTKYAFRVNLKNTSEVFASSGSTEYSLKHNRVLFVEDYAFLFDTDFGKGGTGTAFDGNIIENVQIQNNMTGLNGLVKFVGGTGSIFDVQITDNQNIYPYFNSTIFIPVVINGPGMTNLMHTGNVYNGRLFPSGSPFPGITTAVDVTGTISGVVNSFNNQYIGYTSQAELEERIGINVVSPAYPIDGTTFGTSSAIINMTRKSNTVDVGYRSAPTGALSGSNASFFVGIPGSANYGAGTAFDGTTGYENFKWHPDGTTTIRQLNSVGVNRTSGAGIALDITGPDNAYGRITRGTNGHDGFVIMAPAGALAVGNSQYSFGLPFSSANFVIQKYNGTAATDIMTITESNNDVAFSASTLVTMSAYGAGTATFDASGNITSVSDERVKRNISRYRTGLSAIMKIKPITFRYSSKSGNETKNYYNGFSAQNIESALGSSSIGVNKDGYKSIQDRSIIAALVNGMQEQQIMIQDLQKEIINLKNKR